MDASAEGTTLNLIHVEQSSGSICAVVALAAPLSVKGSLPFACPGICFDEGNVLRAKFRTKPFGICLFFQPENRLPILQSAARDRLFHSSSTTCEAVLDQIC